MVKRKIIRIDEDKCNGCGQCVVDCAEAALQVVNGKARLIKEIYCDGLGACLGSCPTGALTVEERESEPFDESATEKHMEKMKEGKHKQCPGTIPLDFGEKTGAPVHGETKPELTNWPVQLKLAAVKAPFLDGADLLLAADCTAFAAVNYHERFIKGKKLLIGCPKLDDSQFYFEKLTKILSENSVRALNVVRMEVPCCGGLAFIARESIKKSGKDIPYHEVVIGIKGEIKSEGKGTLIPKLPTI